MAFTDRLKSAPKPLRRFASLLNPTAVGVLLSVGAHVAIIAYGPRANFSFAALTEAAQQADAEETIVPLVQLTPAEQSRLPSFAQPRRSPPNPAGLGSLSLPPGLPSISNSRILRTPTAARPLPSPTTTLPRPTARQVPSFRTSINPSVLRPRQPVNLPTARPAPSVSVIPTPSPNTPTDALPTLEPADPSITVPDDVAGLLLPSGEQDGNQDGNNGSAGNGGTAADLQGQRPGQSIDEALRAQEAAGQDNDQEVASSEGSDASASSANPGEESGEEIAVEPADVIETAPAQGNADRLLSGFEYDPTGVDDVTAQENLEAWLISSAENKGEVSTDTAELTIDSNFKVCKEVPPARGLIGVIVNPDGTQESAQVLKSIGYDLLNRQALDAVAYSDFGQPETPTQYQVSIDVNYSPEGCVEELPEGSEAPAAE
ncbi:MAG: energy transducer TonB [Cyanobacteria bacterium J06614_10]